MSLRETTFWTYHDAVSHVVDAYQSVRSQVPFRNAKRAVMNAYRDIPGMHRWTYYERRGQVVTVASQSSSTITYDHTGGTYERELTLASGTWPTWAKYGSIIINDNRYQVEERKSSTVLTLTEDANPGADVAAGTSYNLYRSIYPLPIGFKRTEGLVEVANAFWLDYVTSGAALDNEVGNYQPSRPNFYAIRSSEDFPGRMCVEFSPPPVDARTYDFVYERFPRSLKVYKETAGTVSVSSGSASVTGSGTAFSDRMVGSIIRFGTSAIIPTGEAGDHIDGDLEDAEFEEQAVVKSVESATALTLESGVSSTYSAVKYLISDPIDIEPGVMLTLFMRKCEAEYLRLQGRQNSANRGELEEADRQVMIARREAMAASARDRNRRFPASNRIQSLSDWAIIDE